MKLFNINNKNLDFVKENPFKKEREIQSLIEKNIENIFNLEFIKSEFSIDKFRIDTLAFDKETNSFVIIEYKKGSSYSVIDQGFTYLSLLLNKKSDFVLEYNESNDKSVKRGDIDWSQSKIIFISPNFSAFQKTSVNFKDVPFELWEIKRFAEKTIILNPLRSNSKESIGLVGKSENSLIKEVSKEIKVYNEDDHIKKANEYTLDLYNKYKHAILNIGNIEIEPLKEYIAFKADKNVVDIEIQKSAIKIHINLKIGKLLDGLYLMRDMSSIGHYGNGDYELSIKNEENFDYIIGLIRQSYDKQMS
jgi:predicted transport protein